MAHYKGEVIKGWAVLEEGKYLVGSPMPWIYFTEEDAVRQRSPGDTVNTTVNGKTIVPVIITITPRKSETKNKVGKERRKHGKA